MRRIPLALSVAMTLVGCAPPPVTYWARPGAPASAFDADADICEARARAAAPPMALGQLGYYSGQDMWCQPTAGGTNCMIIGAGYLPQPRSEGDANAAARDALFRSCMIGAGWRTVSSPAEGEMITRSGPVLSQTAVSAALKTCDGIFKGRHDAKRMAAYGNDYDRCVMTEAGKGNAGP